MLCCVPGVTDATRGSVEPSLGERATAPSSTAARGTTVSKEDLQRAGRSAPRHLCRTPSSYQTHTCATRDGRQRYVQNWGAYPGWCIQMTVSQGYSTRDSFTSLLRPACYCTFARGIAHRLGTSWPQRPSRST